MISCCSNTPMLFTYSPNTPICFHKFPKNTPWPSQIPLHVFTNSPKYPLAFHENTALLSKLFVLLRNLVKAQIQYNILLHTHERHIELALPRGTTAFLQQDPRKTLWSGIKSETPLPQTQSRRLVARLLEHDSTIKIYAPHVAL